MPHHPLAERWSWHRPAGLLLYCMLTIIASMALVLKMGRDTPWDYFSYHAYSAYLLFHDRLAQDYFAAGPQGYMNPIGLLPFALTQLVGLDSIGTAMVLAAVQALNGICLLLICRSLAKIRPDLTAVLVPGCVLGMVSPILLTHLGGTFTDPVGSIFVLGAVWLALAPSTSWRQFGAGVLIAAAVAIKLSNVTFAVAMLPMILLPWRENCRRDWLGRCLSFAGGSALGFLFFQGYWSYKLYVLTGNPLFPFFNGLFRSPLFPTESQSVGRFVPATFTDFLAIPLDLARYASWAHLEMPAPTIVPLAAAIAALIFVCKWLMEFARRRRFALIAPRPTLQLLAFCAISAVLWALTSGNSRYAIPLFLLLGPVLALVVNALCPRRYAILIVWIVLLFQLFMTWDARIQRWRSQQWTPEWVPTDIPVSVSGKPALFISLALQSQSNMVPYLHPDSAFVHLNNGHFSVPSSGPASVSLWRLLDRFGYRAKIILQRSKMIDKEIPLPKVIERGNNYLDRISMRIIDGSCVDVHVNDASGYRIGLNSKLPAPIGQGLLVCDAVRAPSRYAAPRAEAGRIMDAFEDKCPELFVPRRPQVELAGKNVWVRIYPKYDSAVLVLSFEDHYISYLLTGQFNGIVIGTPETWQQDVKKFDCRMPYGGLRGFKGFEAEIRGHE